MAAMTNSGWMGVTFYMIYGKLKGQFTLKLSFGMFFVYLHAL